MLISESIESLRGSLEPIEELRDEHSLLEGWVNESFSSLEKLHEDLTSWQSELARQQTDLDLREDALERAQAMEGGLAGEVQQLHQQLVDARHELSQLEEENGQQLEELEKLERQQAGLQADVEVARSRAEDLAAALEAEKHRNSTEQSYWTKELKQMRYLMERQGEILEGIADGDLADGSGNTDEGACLNTGETADEDAASRSAELRRRAVSRRAAKRQQQWGTEE